LHQELTDRWCSANIHIAKYLTKISCSGASDVNIVFVGMDE
jgi:hypothetical protein